MPALNVEVIFTPLIYSLFNCEVEVDLFWTKDFVLMGDHNNITGVNFVITSTKLYLPRITLSINENNKFLENIKQEFKKAIYWNKYGTEVTTQPKTISWSR